MTNAMNNLRAFEENLVCVKAMIFEKKLEMKPRAYATVLCCVPEEDYHETCLGIGPNGRLYTHSCGKVYFPSHGTFIRVVGRNLMSPSRSISLTAYERYLEKEGWSFVATVTMAKGEKKAEAFQICRKFMQYIKALRHKI